MDLDSPEKDFSSTSNQLALSPDLFSSEDETCKTDEPSQPSPVLSKPMAEKRKDHEDSLRVLESSRLHRLMELLQGVPPPPSVTIPQISLAEVLKKLKENISLSGDQGEAVFSLWKPNASLEEVLNAKWPDMKNILYHDIHYNNCNASEDVELYSMKLHDRYIGAETSSWCNAISSSMPNSAKKRQRTRGLGNTSPGCRLSHLARRRQTFSSANLAQLSSVAGSGKAGGATAGNHSGSQRSLMNGGSRRRIMVEIKKTDKNKRIKTNSKEAVNRLPPNASKPIQAEPPIQSTKRALFLSPEEQKRVAPVPSATATSETNALPKRALWPSEKEALLNENGKRNLSISDVSCSQRSKMHCSDDRAPYRRTTRSLPFSLGQNSASSGVISSNTNSQSNSGIDKQSRRASDQGPSAMNSNPSGILSELHKRKLFWAITLALRNVGITKHHSDFTSLASSLAYHYIEIRKSMTGPAPTSTSEHMLKVVTSKVDEVLQAHHSSKGGQEENQGGNRVQRKEERSNKELFRDATASLNVRRSLCVSLSSSNHQTSDGKPKQTKKVPSARKSLSFDAIDPKTSSSGTVSEEPMDKADSKYQLDSKGNDSKRRCNGENVPLACAKRVSRSLFLSPKDETKVSKKDPSEQTCAPETEHIVTKNSDEVSDIACGNVELTSLDKRKPVKLDTCDDERIQQGSEVSSIPSVGAISSTLEADNEASRTSEATTYSEQANSDDTSTNLVSSTASLNPNGIDVLTKCATSVITDNLKVDSGSSESSEYVSTRILRGTKERAARFSAAQPAKRNSQKSLSLTRRDTRSSSTDSVDQELSLYNRHVEKSASSADVGNSFNNVSVDIPKKIELRVTLSPTKAASPTLTSDTTTSKSAFGSPPFIGDNLSLAPQSPFLGFPAKEDQNSPGGALNLVVDGANSILKAPAAAEGSSWLDTTSTPKPDVTSEDGNLSENGKLIIGEKVITPLLEAGVLESSVCVGSGSSHSTDADLSFRGRIESLKPSNVCDSIINLDLGLNLNVSANILNLDENKEKSPVLEKWAERASRSAQKNCILSEDTNEPVVCTTSANVSIKSRENLVEESLLPWEESQLEGASQCSTVMFEKFRSIFDSSSHQGDS